MNKTKGCILQKSFADGNVYFGQAKCSKMAKLWMSQVSQSVPTKYINITDYSNKGDLQKPLD